MNALKFMEGKKHIYWTLGILSLISVGVAGNRYYQQSRPLYCLKQAKEAYDTHNLIQFKKYVNVESIVDNMVDQVMKQTINQTASVAFTNTDKDIPMGSKIISFLKPMFIQTLSQEIYQMVERPESIDKYTSDAGNTFFSPQKIVEQFSKQAFILKKIENIEIKGEKAYLTLAFVEGDQNEKTILVEVIMRRVGDDWQLTELPNLATILEK